MWTRWDSPPAPAVSTTTPAIRSRRSNGDSWTATIWILPSGAIVVFRQTHPLRKSTASFVVGPAETPDPLPRVNGGPPEHQDQQWHRPHAKRPGQHDAQQRDEDGGLRQLAPESAWIDTVPQHVRIVIGQHRAEKPLDLSAPQDRGEPLALRLRGALALAARRIDSDRHAAAQTVQRALLDGQRLNPVDGNRRRDARQQPVLQPQILAGARQP